MIPKDMIIAIFTEIFSFTQKIRFLSSCKKFHFLKDHIHILDDLMLNKRITDDILRSYHNLTILNISDNKNVTVDGLKNLQNLVDLNITGIKSNITQEDICQLKKLENIDISHNIKITDISNSILPNLKTVCLRDATYRKNILISAGFNTQPINHIDHTNYRDIDFNFEFIFSKLF